MIFFNLEPDIVALLTLDLKWILGYNYFLCTPIIVAKLKLCSWNKVKLIYFKVKALALGITFYKCKYGCTNSMSLLNTFKLQTEVRARQCMWCLPVCCQMHNSFQLHLKQAQTDLNQKFGKIEKLGSIGKMALYNSWLLNISCLKKICLYTTIVSYSLQSLGIHLHNALKITKNMSKIILKKKLKVHKIHIFFLMFQNIFVLSFEKYFC